MSDNSKNQPKMESKPKAGGPISSPSKYTIPDTNPYIIMTCKTHDVKYPGNSKCPKCK